MDKLKPNEKIFADQYLKHGVKARAVRESGSKAVSTSAQTQIANDHLKKAKVIAYLESMQDKAVNKIDSLIDSEREDIALKASTEVLDRTGIVKSSKKEIHKTTLNVNLSEEDSREIGSIKRLLGNGS